MTTAAMTTSSTSSAVMTMPTSQVMRCMASIYRRLYVSITRSSARHFSGDPILARLTCRIRLFSFRRFLSLANTTRV